MTKKTTSHDRFDLTHHGDEIIIEPRGNGEHSMTAFVKKQTGMYEHRTTKITAPSIDLLMRSISMALSHKKGD